jgi:hypothetical protein
MAAKAFWWQWPMQQDFALAPADRPAMRPAAASRARNSSRTGLAAERCGFGARQHRQELVAQGQQAGGLQPDDGYAALEMRRARRARPSASARASRPDRRTGTCARSTAAARRPPRGAERRDSRAAEHFDGVVQVLGSK